MPSPYSIDFRKKIVEVYKTDDLSQTELAKRFKISLSSVKRYLNLAEETGDLSPKTGAKGRPAKITDCGLEMIKAIIKENPTITLRELSELLDKEKNIKASFSMLSRACKKLKLRRKKLSKYASEQEREDIKKNAKTTLKK